MNLSALRFCVDWQWAGKVPIIYVLLISHVNTKMKPITKIPEEQNKSILLGGHQYLKTRSTTTFWYSRQTFHGQVHYSLDLLQWVFHTMMQPKSLWYKSDEFIYTCMIQLASMAIFNRWIYDSVIKAKSCTVVRAPSLPTKTSRRSIVACSLLQSIIHGIIWLRTWKSKLKYWMPKAVMKIEESLHAVKDVSF